MSQLSGDNKAPLGPRSGQEAQAISHQLQGGWPWAVLSDPVHVVWSLSSGGNLASQETCSHTGAVGRPASRLHNQQGDAQEQ